MADTSKKTGRGPTDLKRFWKEYDPNNKINLVYNREGQPFGTKTCRLTNFLGSLVKGEEISLGANNWWRVPNQDKIKLWSIVKVKLHVVIFFEICCYYVSLTNMFELTI